MEWGAVRPTNELGAVRDAAADLIGRGFKVCALDPDEKKPTYPEWPVCLLTPDDFEGDEGIGIMTGPVSGGPDRALVVVDLDSPQAVRLADAHLPPTAMLDGRPSKPNSHRYYLVPLDSVPQEKYSTAPMAASAAINAYGHPGPKIEHFEKVLDVIGTGGQVACPPTLHKSGEVREWAGGQPGEPAVIPYPTLLCAVNSLLAACGYSPRKAIPAPKVRAASSFASPPHIGRREVSFAEVAPWLKVRVHSYLDALPPAISGQGGDKQTFKVASALTWGFALDCDAALHFLAERYNPRCVPPWTVEDLRRKVECASNATSHVMPRGYLLRNRIINTIDTEWTTL